MSLRINPKTGKEQNSRVSKRKQKSRKRRDTKRIRNKE